MNIFHIEISTSSNFPTVDVQHLLFQLTEMLQAQYGEARRDAIAFPIELSVEGVTGTLYLRTVESENPAASTSDDMDEFLDDISRRLNEDDDAGGQ